MDLHQLEQFALAEDRQKALEQFVPGTEDYYFHQCLVHEQAGDLAAVERTLTTWIDRHGRTARVEQIHHRLMLLRFEEQPDQTVDHLRRTLGLHFDHQRVVEGQRVDYPDRLDPALLERDEIRRRGLQHSGHGDLNGFRNPALRWLSAEGMKIEQVRALLGRLRTPDHPALVEWVLAELDDRYSQGFGSLHIHARLTLEQLERLGAERPALLGVDPYVHAVLVRLAPGPEVDWEHDPAEHRAYLTRMGAFVDTLDPKYNPLRAHILYHRLDLERRQGRYDRALLLAYLALPRRVATINPEYLERFDGHVRPFSLGQDFASLTGHPSVGSDEPLIRDYLEHLWVEDPDPTPFSQYLRQSFIEEVLATTLLLAGEGDLEELTSMLGDPAAFARLKDRVELSFAPQNPQWFSADDPVTLEIDVKNVQTLLCKVFEINTLAYFSARGAEVDTSIDLDGLVASEEQVHEYEEPPLRRVRRRLELPSLAKPGVYVVELIGGGLSSRALVRKGRLRLLERTGAAGHMFTVLDEDARPLPEATLWLEGREYPPGPSGTINVPFSTRPGRKSVLLRHGEVTTVETFVHQAERYHLQAGIYIDREALVRGARAAVIVRPRLLVNGTPASLTLIEHPTLVVRSTDLDGVEARVEIPQFELHGDRESTHTLEVPERVRRITVSLRGEVQNLSGGETVELSDQRTFELNGIDQEDTVEDLHLARTADGYVVVLVGRSGEPKAKATIRVQLHHRDLVEAIDVVLETDASGRVELGELGDVSAVEANTAAGRHRRWTLPSDRSDWPPAIHGRAGATIRVPYMGRAPLRASTPEDAEPPASPTVEQLREDVSLLELRGSAYVRDRFDAVRHRDGFLELHGLPAGDYELTLWRAGVTITVRLGGGQPRGAWIAGVRRQLERRGPPPLQIQSVRVEEQSLAVQLGYAGRGTRVHVFGTRFVPEYDPFITGRRSPRVVRLSRARSHYVSGRDIGDEYRYILERRREPARVGTMLTRPGLLLAPWAVRKTETGAQEAAEGGAYASSPPPPPRAAAAPAPAEAPSRRGPDGGQANLDFLAHPAAVLVNLEPDEHGVVRIPRAAIEHASQLRVLAVDAHQTVCRTVPCIEAITPHRDLRLRLGLTPTEHYTEQKQVTVRPGGAPLTIGDITTSKVEVYDTLARVYQLYASVSGDATLEKFSMILRWPSATEDERRAFYSEFSCHELNLLLSRKDPEFFDRVIAPHLRNKKHKTFIDHYLLGDDLSGYLRPWAYGRLNVVERILLAHRIEDERDGCARHVGDLDDLDPPDLERSAHLFRAALQGSALSGDDPLGMNAAAEQQKEQMLSRPSLRTMSASFGPPGGPAGPPQLGGASRGGGRKRKKLDRRRESDLDELVLSDDDDELAELALHLDDADYDALEEVADGYGGGGLTEDRVARERQQRLFRAPDTTQEWAENNYYERPLAEQGPELVTANPFWRDFAEHRHRGPFVSPNLHHACRSFTEMMCALAVLDLPFESTAPEVTFEGPRMTMRGGSTAVVFHEQIEPSPAVAEPSPILVAQHYLRHDDRYRYDGAQAQDKVVTGELLVGVVYACKVVLTNPTSATYKLDVLLQIPVGSLPVGGGPRTQGRAVELGPQGTQTIEYRFYFPSDGTFDHFPVHVSADGQLIASVPPQPLTVVDEPSEVDRDSWAWISHNGTDDEVLAWMDAHNLARLARAPGEGLEQCAWRMKDRAFHDRCLALLTRRHVYDRVLWSYSLVHRDAANIEQLLLHEEYFLDRCGESLRSPLVHIDAELRGRYEHLEYAPLVNARAHRLGARHEILNDRFSEQYTRLLEVLRQKPALTPVDQLAVAGYLLLQDRFEEGLGMLDRIDPATVDTRLQLDYLRVYAHFLREQPEQARVIAEGYRDYPVDRWRHRFAEALAQLDELSGQAPEVSDPEDREQQQTTLAAAEPDLELQVEQGTVTVTYRNLTAATLRFYRMDVELLFSRQPFVQQQSEQFSFVRPNLEQPVALPSDAMQWSAPLPEALTGANVIVEVVAGSLRRSTAYFAHALSVQLSPRYGQLRVTQRSDQTPLPRTYVKVYARMQGGAVKFYKDGYTDLRGRFDYASLSTDDLDSVERFSLLVLSREHGALVREASPPPR